MTTVIVIAIYLGLLLGLALFAKTLFRGTSKDYFVASHSIGPFMLLMSVFGTTMTAFALVGSTGKAFGTGIGTYGLMASSSGLIHAACFLLIGIKLWAIGKRYGYVTQIQYFRARFESKAFGYLLFPILVLLVIPYLLIGVIGAAKTIEGVTKAKVKPSGDLIAPGVFPEWTDNGAIPPWFTGLVICIVVLTYIFAGGSRAAAWANTFQTIVFMIMGVLAFYLISGELGGVGAAIEQAKDTHKVRTVDGTVGVSQLTFLTYMFIPLSVGMFPHLFQHWLTAKSAKSFKLTVVAHPICIAIVWVPCVLIGIWASGQLPAGANPASILSIMVSKLVADPLIVGLVTAGILAAIMSSLDSQFLCLGTMFTNDIMLHDSKKNLHRQTNTPYGPRIHRSDCYRDLSYLADPSSAGKTIHLRSSRLELLWICSPDPTRVCCSLLEAFHQNWCLRLCHRSLCELAHLLLHVRLWWRTSHLGWSDSSRYHVVHRCRRHDYWLARLTTT